MKYTIIKRLDKRQTIELHNLYQEEWWTSTRTKSEVKAMLQHTDIVIGLVNKKGKLIRFARVLTDRVFKAEIYDVIVHPKYRNKKLGHVLMEAILHHKKLKNVKQFNLQCKPEMVGYYEQWDFAEQNDLVYMRYSR